MRHHWSHQPPSQPVLDALQYELQATFFRDSAFLSIMVVNMERHDDEVGFTFARNPPEGGT